MTMYGTSIGFSARFLGSGRCSIFQRRDSVKSRNYRAAGANCRVESQHICKIAFCQRVLPECQMTGLFGSSLVLFSLALDHPLGRNSPITTPHQVARALGCPSILRRHDLGGPCDAHCTLRTSGDAWLTLKNLIRIWPYVKTHPNQAKTGPLIRKFWRYFARRAYHRPGNARVYNCKQKASISLGFSYGRTGSVTMADQVIKQRPEGWLSAAALTGT